MFHNNNNVQISGVLGMFGALLFFSGLVVEYRYGLFPPGDGTLFVLNQIQFTLAMICLLVMLWQYRRMRAGGDGRFARITLTLFPTSWALLILGNIASLLTGYNSGVLLALGGLSGILFGLLAGIAVARNKVWPGWGRFALLFQGLYNLLVIIILPIALTGTVDPNFVTESGWMGTWFLVSLALYQYARNPRMVEPLGKVVG